MRAESQARIEAQAEYKAKQHRDGASIRAQAHCSRVAPAEIADCVYEEHGAARDAERNEYDLQAQLVTSVWTQAMGMAALIGMAVGILGIGLIYKTFEETRRTAKTAEDSLEHARTVTELEMRPWIDCSIRPFNMRKEGDGLSIGVAIVLSNTGKSPALNVCCGVGGFTLSNDDHTKIFAFFNSQYTETGELSERTILPGSTGEVILTAVISPEDIDIEKDEKRELFYPTVAANVAYKWSGREISVMTSRAFLVGPLDADDDVVAVAMDELPLLRGLAARDRGFSRAT